MSRPVALGRHATLPALAVLLTLSAAALVATLRLASPEEQQLRRHLLADAHAAREQAWREASSASFDPRAVRADLVTNVLGWPAERPPAGARVLRTFSRAGLDYDIVTFDSEPGVTVPAVVVKASGGPPRRPGLVHLHQYGSDLSLGHSKDLDVVESFARRGFVVASDSSLLFEDRRDDTSLPQAGREFAIGRAMLALGRPLLGQWLFDHSRLVDYLAERPDVDPARLGAFGLSKGGWEALWLAATEPRLAAILSVAGANDMVAIMERGSGNDGHLVTSIVRAETLLPRLTTPRALRVQLGTHDRAVPAAWGEGLYGPMRGLPGFEIGTSPTERHEWGPLDRIEAWFVQRLRPEPTAAVAGAPSAWLSGTSDNGATVVIRVPASARYYPWVASCDRSGVEGSLEVRFGDRMLGTVTTVYNEREYLARTRSHELWQPLPPVDLPAGAARFDVRPGSWRPCAIELRLTADERAAPAGALRLSVLPLLSPADREALRPAVLLTRLAARAAARRRARVEPPAPVVHLGEAQQAPGSLLPEPGPLDRAGHGTVAVLLAGEREGALRAYARDARLDVIDLHGTALRPKVRDWAARSALQIGTPLAARLATELAVIAHRRGPSRTVLLVDEVFAPAGLLAARGEPCVARLVVTSLPRPWSAGGTAGGPSLLDLLPDGLAVVDGAAASQLWRDERLVVLGGSVR